MPALPIKLTDEFVRAAVADGCTTEIILDVQAVLTASLTAGTRLISLYDDPRILPGSGWYQRSHRYDLVGRTLHFDTLHLNIAYDVQGHLVGYLSKANDATRLVTREQRQQLREIGLMIAGQAYNEGDS